MESTLENHQRVYQMLEDEQSKFIYLNRLNYLISGDFRFIKEITPMHLREPRIPIYTACSPSSAIPDSGKIVLYGTGACPKNCFSEWSRDQRVIAFCSQNKKKQKTGYLGYPVISPEELLAQSEYFVVVAAIDPYAKADILKILREADYPEDKILFLLDKQEDRAQYFPEDVVAFGDDEVFVDVGCYKLETSLELRKRCPSLKKVYAFEPDPTNYKACEEKKAQTGFDEAEILPFGTWSHKDTLHFANEGTSGAAVVDAETALSIDVVAIDEVICPENSPKVTFLKMDVEGSEMESLKGARELIQRDKPKLAICIYHKPEDMVEIPLYIKKLVPEYKLYVRHHTNYISETVLYAIP